jgi:hypothetical protein
MFSIHKQYATTPAPGITTTTNTASSLLIQNSWNYRGAPCYRITTTPANTQQIQQQTSTTATIHNNTRTTGGRGDRLCESGRWDRPPTQVIWGWPRANIKKYLPPNKKDYY